jgi:hypothetical protein
MSAQTEIRDSAVPTLITQADPVGLIETTVAQLNRIILG